MFNPKKSFFKKKVKSVQRSIWEIEFKIAKSRQVREGVRQDRDRAIEACARIETILKTIEKKEEKEKLEAELKELQDNKERYEKQMKMIDDEINGGVPSEMNPNGIGLLETVKSMVELKKMYNEYIKSI